MKGCVNQWTTAVILTYQRHRAKEIDVEKRAPFFYSGITDPLHLSQSAVINYKAIDARECLECNRGHLFANLQLEVSLVRVCEDRLPSQGEEHYVRL